VSNIFRFVNGVYEYHYKQCKKKKAIIVALRAVSIVYGIIALMRGYSEICIERHGLVHAPQLFIVYYHDVSGKEVECCIAILPVTILLSLSSQYNLLA